MSKISGAQNLSGCSKFPPGHWALGLQKLKLVRFHSRAWLGRAGGGWCWAVGRGLLDAPRVSAGRPVSGPYDKNGRFPDTPQGRVLDLPVPSPGEGGTHSVTDEGSGPGYKSGLFEP